MIGLTAGKHIFISLTKPVDETGFFLLVWGMGYEVWGRIFFWYEVRGPGYGEENIWKIQDEFLIL
jgi:hypothetical protein